jgi:integrase
VELARSEALAFLVVLLGGEAGLRCGEIMALEWTDIDFAKR